MMMAKCGCALLPARLKDVGDAAEGIEVLLMAASLAKQIRAAVDHEGIAPRLTTWNP
jgi:hypothetical protein